MGNTAVTCSGLEFKAFWIDPEWWPDGRFIDHHEITVDGLDLDYGDNCATFASITPSSIVVIPPQGGVYDDDCVFKSVPITEYFRQWSAQKAMKRE